MAITAWKGPLIAFGQSILAGSGLGQPSDPSGSRSPSLFDQGLGIMDPRAPFTYSPGQAMGGTTVGDRGAYGWWGTTHIAICNQVPSTISTSAIAAAQVPVAGTALTLRSTTGAGITVSSSVTNASTGATVTGLLAIDTAMTPVQNGTSGGNLFWDPTKAIARCLQYTSAGDDSAATATAAGYDVYGYPMTETVTLTNGTVVTGTKAFKYIASITPAGTLSGSNLSVGQSDTIGFMLRSDLFTYLKIYWPDNTLIASATGYTAAVTTTATATTGDVRGTYALQGSASNNARRLVIFLQVPLSLCGTAAGLVGPVQA